MKRRLCKIAATLCLLLGLATVVDWIVGHSIYHQAYLKHFDSNGSLQRSSGCLLLKSGDGRLYLLYFGREFAEPYAGEWTLCGWTGHVEILEHDWVLESYDPIHKPAPSLLNRLGFAYPDGYVSVPHWSLTLLFSVPPAMWLWISRRRRWVATRRLSRGLCSNCGYDLRASAERCPECGVSVPPGHTLRVNP